MHETQRAVTIMQCKPNVKKKPITTNMKKQVDVYRVGEAKGYLWTGV